MTSLEAELDAAVNMTADEALVPLMSDYKAIGRSYASRDPDIGVERETVAHDTIAAQLRENLRRARAT